MNTDSLVIEHVGALMLALGACATDIKSRRIPNLLTFGGAAVGIAARLVLDGWTGAAWGLGGWTLGLLMLLPLFLLRGMGAGDVKLLAALGAWVGPRLVAWTGLYGAIAGGVLAVAVASWHGVFRQTLVNVGLLTTHWRVAGLGPVEGLTLQTSRGPKLPYAIPLTCGLVVALWLQA